MSLSSQLSRSLFSSLCLCFFFSFSLFPFSMTMTMITRSVGSLCTRSCDLPAEARVRGASAKSLVGALLASRRKNLSWYSVQASRHLEWNGMGKRASLTSSVLLEHKKWWWWCVWCGECVLCCAALCYAAVCRVVSVVLCCCLSVVVCWTDIVVLLVVCLLCGEKTTSHVFDGSKKT